MRTQVNPVPGPQWGEGVKITASGEYNFSFLRHSVPHIRLLSTRLLVHPSFASFKAQEKRLPKSCILSLNSIDCIVQELELRKPVFFLLYGFRLRGVAYM